MHNNYNYYQSLGSSAFLVCECVCQSIEIERGLFLVPACEQSDGTNITNQQVHIEPFAFFPFSGLSFNQSKAKKKRAKNNKREESRKFAALAKEFEGNSNFSRCCWLYMKKKADFDKQQ